MLRSRSEILVPECIKYAHDCESRGDDNKALVSKRGSLGRDILVLAPFKHSFVNTVQADAVRVGFSRNLVELRR